MNKDIFEQRIGQTLRNSEFSPPAGAWEAIQAQIGNSGGGGSTPHYSVIPSVIIGVVLLSSLWMYSSFHSGQEVNPDLTNSAKAISENELEVESTSGVMDIAKKEVVGEDQIVETSSEDSPESEPNSALPIMDRKESTEPSDPFRPSSQNVSEIALPAPVIEEAQLVERKQENSVDSNLDLPQPKPSSGVTIDVNEASENSDIFGIAPVNRVGYTPFEVNLSALGNARDLTWDLGSKGVQYGKDCKVVFDKPGEYMVFLQGLGTDGKILSESITFTVNEGSTLFAPVSFTPNKDGINDTYQVSGTNISEFSMTIVNSSGKVVFQTRDINQGWTYDASIHPLGNEFYRAIIRAVGEDGKQHAINQPLTILTH